jgi:hypothetical protein
MESTFVESYVDPSGRGIYRTSYPPTVIQTYVTSSSRCVQPHCYIHNNGCKAQTMMFVVSLSRANHAAALISCWQQSKDATIDKGCHRYRDEGSSNSPPAFILVKMFGAEWVWRCKVRWGTTRVRGWCCQFIQKRRMAECGAFASSRNE